MQSLLLLLIFGVTSSLAQESQILKEFSTGYNEFTADVYKELLKSQSGNFIVCPLSADIILALTSSGARGQTAKELTTALRLPENAEKVQEVFKAISPNLYSSEKYNLSSANKAYVQNEFKISDQFKKVAVDVFAAEIQNIDFSKKEEAANEINKWVEEKTHDKIKELIKPDMLDSATGAVLVNALYFMGKWVKEFDTRATSNLPFFTNKRDYKNTDMMILNDYFEYYESPELNAKFLKLDYEGGDVSMHIVLPNNKLGLFDLEEYMSEVLTPPTYSTVEVSVRIPKFKTESQIQFKPILEAMGVKTAFGQNADFRGIGAHEENLLISEVVQKAFIEVEEKGTTAAAATAPVLTMFSAIMGPEPMIFHADHPFLYYLRLNKLGVNFFVGRYVSP